MSDPNVLGKRPRPTRTTYRGAVAKVIRLIKLREGLGNTAFADRIGCSDDTVANAENEVTSLDPVLLLNIEHEFGPGAIDMVTALAGSHCVPEDLAQAGDILPALLRLGGGLAEARSPDSPGGVTETDRELLKLEPAFLDVRRGVNRILARISKLKG